MKLKGKISRILFSTEEGFLVATLEEGAKISGVCTIAAPETLEGQDVVLEGEWQEHPRFGPQFRFEHLAIEGSELYFYLTKVVKGVGRKLVRRLIDHYGEEELLRILDEEPQTLLGFKGIKEKKLAQITESWQRYKEIRQLAMFLAPYKIGQSLIAEIYRTFVAEENLVEKIRQNPYIITKAKGVGFKRADEMALSMGIDPHSPFRIEAAVDYLLKTAADREGESAVPWPRLVSMVCEALESDDEKLIEEVLEGMVSKASLFVLSTSDDTRYVAHPLYYRAEAWLYDFFTQRSDKRHSPLTDDLNAFIIERERATGFSLGEEQKRALALLNDGVGVLALVGYAGTGKSTCSRALLDLLAERFSKDGIMTTALSGIAAQRIQETTGYKSATIQSLLVAHKEKETFDFDVLLLDEASMVNSQIFYQLLRKLKEEAILIVVGDDGQLPPIGAGNVLHDLVHHRLVPVVKLTKIYRQKEKQSIPFVADAIRKGTPPRIDEEAVDFRFVDVHDEDFLSRKYRLSDEERRARRETLNRRILEAVLREAEPYVLDARRYLHQKRIARYLTHLQVITPMKGGVLGVEHLNKRLQQLFNPGLKHAISKGTYTYALFDKVVHIKNENMPTYTPEAFKKGLDATPARIFNGMIGYIFKIDVDEEECYVYYPTEEVVVRYGFESLSEYLMLAYALTIHKTQGMEYDTVIIPMTYSHYIMHNTKLLYTAVTRAKKMCLVVGEASAFTNACRRLDTTKRTTVLSLLSTKAHNDASI